MERVEGLHVMLFYAVVIANMFKLTGIAGHVPLQLIELFYWHVHMCSTSGHAPTRQKDKAPISTMLLGCHN